MLSKRQLVAGPLLASAIFLTITYSPMIAPQFSQNIFAPTSVKAAEDLNLTIEWDKAGGFFRIKFNNNPQMVGNVIKIRFDQHSDLFINGTLKVSGVKNGAAVPVSSSGEISLTVSSYDSTPVASRVFYIDGNVDADFNLGVNIEEPDGTVIANPVAIEIETKNSGEVRAKNKIVDNTISNETSAPANNTQPEGCGAQAPISIPDLFQISTNNNQAKLFWSPISGDKTEYVISYSTTAGGNEYGLTLPADNEGGVKSVDINALNSNSTYYFNVRAQNGCMPGDWSTTLMAKTGSSSASSQLFHKYN